MAKSKNILVGFSGVEIPDAAVSVFEKAFTDAPDTYPSIEARNDKLREILRTTMAECQITIRPVDVYEALGLPGGEEPLPRLFYRDMRRLLDVLTVEFGQEPEVKEGKNVVDATIALLRRLRVRQAVEKRAAPISIPLFLKKTRTEWDA